MFSEQTEQKDAVCSHTTVSADHITGGELFHDVRTVFAFGACESNVQVEPEGLLLRWLGVL
jgi:hypothetical protein